MNAVLKNVMVPYGTPVVRRGEVRKVGIVRTGMGRRIALAVAAPFIGLAYAAAFPFVAVGMIAWYGGKALAKKLRATYLRRRAATARRIRPPVISTP